MFCFAALFLFFFAQVTFWFCSLHVTNKHVVKGLSLLPTLLGQWLYSGISLKTHISEILTAKCQMYYKLHHLIVKVRESCGDGQTFSGHPTQSLFSVETTLSHPCFCASVVCCPFICRATCVAVFWECSVFCCAGEQVYAMQRQSSSGFSPNSR